MQLVKVRKSNSMPHYLSYLTVVGIVAAAIVTMTFLINAGLPGLSTTVVNASGPVYNVQLPNRAATFFQATTSLGHGRVQLQQGGNPAALAAVYVVSGGIDIYTINPQNGQGSLAYHILTAELQSARTSAASTNSAVQVIPSAFLQGIATVVPSATPRSARLRATVVPTEVPGANLNPKVYALPDGSCSVQTSFPDGTPVQFTFTC